MNLFILPQFVKFFKIIAIHNVNYYISYTAGVLKVYFRNIVIILFYYQCYYTYY